MYFVIFCNASQDSIKARLNSMCQGPWPQFVKEMEFWSGQASKCKTASVQSIRKATTTSNSTSSFICKRDECCQTKRLWPLLGLSLSRPPILRKLFTVPFTKPAQAAKRFGIAELESAAQLAYYWSENLIIDDNQWYFFVKNIEVAWMVFPWSCCFCCFSSAFVVLSLGLTVVPKSLFGCNQRQIWKQKTTNRTRKGPTPIS